MNRNEAIITLSYCLCRVTMKHEQGTLFTEHAVHSVRWQTCTCIIRNVAVGVAYTVVFVCGADVTNTLNIRHRFLSSLLCNTYIHVYVIKIAVYYSLLLL